MLGQDQSPTHVATIEALARKAHQALDELLDRMIEEADAAATSEYITACLDTYDGLVRLHRDACLPDGGYHLPNGATSLRPGGVSDVRGAGPTAAASLEEELAERMRDHGPGPG